jgi:hypothetical protein
VPTARYHPSHGVAGAPPCGLYDRPAVDPHLSDQPPRLPVVDAAPSGSSRRPPVGAVVAAVALIAAIALLAAALAGLPPFTAQGSPSPLLSPTPTGPPSASASPTPSPSASPTPLSEAEILARLQAIEQRMTEIRDLPAAASVTPRLIGSAEATGILVKDFRNDNPPSLLTDENQLYRALGMLRPDEDLGAVFERFLSTQVLGFYRSTDKTLYVISDTAFGPLQGLTAAHEYTHALQDATFDLAKVRVSAGDQSDQALARLSLIEGDATLAMSQWAIQDLSPEELSQLLAEAQDPVAQQALAEAPALIRETQTFPYSDGLQFVQRAWLAGGWSNVDRAWEEPPDTTEQILHAEKYDAAEPAVAVKLPAGTATGLGTGWTEALADTNGELVTRIWLEQGSGADVAAQAAAGWGGDRIGLYRGPNGAWAVVWVTRWDSATDSVEFERAARASATKLPAVSVKRDQSGVTVAIASDLGLLVRLTSVLP